MAEYIQTILRTLPEEEVTVLKKYDQSARRLIDLALENLTRLIAEVDEHPYLGNRGILARTKSLIKETDPVNSERLKDIVYLRIAIYGNGELISSPDQEERQKALEIDANLIRLLEKLNG